MHRALLLALLAAAASAQTDRIRLNQIGFYPDGPKIAVVVAAEAGPFEVVPVGGGDAVFSGTLGRDLRWSAAGENARQADFSALTVPGTYMLAVPGVGASYPFEIREGVHQEVARAALKGFYFQRASVPLETAYAGAWARQAGHPDTRVLVHPSAATASRPAGTVLSSPGGWYDAGDYNKYVVNSGISTGTLLAAYEWNAGYADALATGIPESGGPLPDLLDEALVNLRWMRTMQDEDGGVYHKLTTANFSGEVMPVNANAARYVVQKSTAATLNFAAVMAQASRVFAAFPEALPGFADETRAAAEAAWAWAQAHPTTVYRQSEMNQAFDPDIQTGEYGDGELSDEVDWAAAELYLTTADPAYLAAASFFDPIRVTTPSWYDVRTLAYHSLLAHRQRIAADVDTAAVRSAVVAHADRLRGIAERSAFRATMQHEDFVWGSNAVAANHGLALMVGYRLTGDARLLDAATGVLDYLLGRNGTGYSFLTGWGDRTPMNIHHRPSRADRVAEPVPGLLAGGPNPGQQDGCAYPSDYPARSYSETWCSYASNEIAINWNAPLAALALAVEAARSPTGRPVDAAEVPDPAAPGFGLRIAPNPFRDSAEVRVSLPAPSTVTVRLVDVLGREVARPLDGAALAAGEHQVGVAAGTLAPGLYVVRVETSGGAAARTVTLAR